MEIVKNETIMNFVCEIICLYKALVFEHKEFVISKRILKAVTEVGACYSNKKIKETFENAIEIEFWLKVLNRLFEKNEESVDFSKTVKSLIEKVENIIVFLEKSL